MSRSTLTSLAHTEVQTSRWTKPSATGAQHISIQIVGARSYSQIQWHPHYHAHLHQIEPPGI
jgi:hypothetical protein